MGQSAERWLEKGYGGAEPAALVQVKDLVQLLDACPL